MKKIQNFLGQILRNIYNLSVAELPVESSSNRQFRLKDKKQESFITFDLDKISV